MKSLKEKMNKLDEKYVSMECLTEAEKKKLPELEKKIEELMKKKRNKAIVRTSLLGAAGLTGAHLYNRWKDKKEQEQDK